MPTRVQEPAAMSNVAMRANGLDTIECDSCQKRSRLRGDLGEPPGWYGLIDGRATDDPGSDQMFDFCSLECVAAWHRKQHRLPREGQGSTANECQCAVCGNPGEYPMNSPCPLGWMILNYDSDDREGVLFCKGQCLGVWIARAMTGKPAKKRSARAGGSNG